MYIRMDGERERDREVCILGRMVEREIERCIY